MRKRGFEINRQGKDYLTIVDEDGKKTRLKGTLFAENFNGPDWIKAEIAKLDKQDSEKIQVDQKLAAEADARLQEAIRKTAQYNLNRYILKEMGNEQSTGKQPITKSESDTGNLGSCYEGDSGEPALLQKSVNREADDSHAQYIEQGLGTSPTSGYGSTQREDAEIALRKNPLSDASSSPLGRSMGAGSEMAESHRRAVEHIHEWSDKNSQDSFGAGPGDYRRQSGKPGRNDGANHGNFERVARQSFRFGELIQKIRSLKKGTKKLEDRLVWINQADKKLPDIDLGLRPALENMEQIAGQTISDLRQAHETKLLQNILRQSASTAPIPTDTFLISGDEAVKSLRMVYERKLLQKLTKYGSLFVTPDLKEFSLLGNATQHNLAMAHDINFVADLAKEPFGLRVPNLGRLNEEAKRMYPVMRKALDYRQMEQLKGIPSSLEVPALQILASNGKMACDSFGKANDFMILRQLNRHRTSFNLPNAPRLSAWSRFVLKKLKSVQEIRIVSKVYKVEKQRAKIIKNCYFHAKWAGSDLQRWEKVFAEYEKSPKKLKMLEGIIDSAHSKFALILSDTQNLVEIQNRCGNDPFLQHEYGILKDKLEQYYSEKKEKESEQTEVDNPKF